ncbi:MAG: methyl-accepting chemotaxis protein [Deltaproteobacteria bacterium]|nr:methyl-accepting chemotaxis protein [Deltaproteobacteria bacterium]
MNDRPQYKRRNYFIDKRFQSLFVVKFLIVLIAAAIVALGLFLYYTSGTITIGYDGSEINLDQTNDYFLRTLLISFIGLIVVTSLIATTVIVFISHKIAGPLFHFKKNLAEISRGDLTVRMRLRENDQCKALAENINEMTSVMDAKMGIVKAQAVELARLIDASAGNPGDRLPAEEMRRRILELQDAANHFTTSPQP